MGHPAKEGLRRLFKVPPFIVGTQSGSSSKRGIKTELVNFKAFSKAPRVGHPAKEGLRQCLQNCEPRILERPRVGHPAKEGLRQRS